MTRKFAITMGFVMLCAALWVLAHRPHAARAQQGSGGPPAPGVGSGSEAAPVIAPVADPPPDQPPVVTDPIAVPPPVEPPPVVVTIPEAPITSIPLGRGLPVLVRVGVYFAEIQSVDENGGSFTATVDVRLRWTDQRLEYPAAQAPGGFREYYGPDAETRLTEIWAPEVAIDNLVGDPAYQVRGLRLFPDGKVEVMQRTTATFSSEFHLEQFPFDRQQLSVDLLSRRDGTTRVVLDFRQDDLDFSQVGDTVAIEGWVPGLLSIKRDPLGGWYGRSHARVTFALEVAREGGASMAAIFIPLMASLLIPLLALWLQRVEDGEIKIEAFELTNILIGGLFAVIALNFTISSEWPALSGSDNAVTRLLALNYGCLALSLLINIVIFRFDAIGRIFGKHVMTVLFQYMIWALPLLVMSTAVAFILLAMA